ncbi:MAG: hypothetical protein U1D55_08280 [Phycisphaerae bacterium]
MTQGRTLEDAKANLRDAIELMLAPVDLDSVSGGKRVVRERIRL